MIRLQSDTLILDADDIRARFPDLDAADDADVTISVTRGEEYQQFPLTEVCLVFKIASEYTTPRAA